MTQRKNAIAIAHVGFEDLGALAAALQHAGYVVTPGAFLVKSH